MRHRQLKTLTRATMLLALFGAAVLGCNREAAPGAAPNSASSGTAAKSALSPDHPTLPKQPAVANRPQAPAAAAGNSVTGTVQETMDAAGYTYVRLQTAQGDQWAAVSQVKVAVGSQVNVVNAMMMRDFHSKSLDRTFPGIWFGQLGGSGVATKRAAPTSQPAAVNAAAPMARRAAPTSQPTAVKPVGPTGGAVALATPRPAGVQSIAQLWARKAELGGKKTRVHGKVVKFNGGVMGKNWIHLQDGSGDASKATHDLTITTQHTAAIGDELTLEGVAATEKDFGGGYNYALIIEDATVVPAR